MVLDRTHFTHMTGGDRALQLEVLGLFRAQAEGWSAALSDGGDWRAAVHTLKGSARGIGFTALARACEAAEAAPDPAPALGSVRQALSEALAALEQFAAETV
jgi:HPt (histidine-containing phosphotransfer) domain-containing protein